MALPEKEKKGGNKWKSPLLSTVSRVDVETDFNTSSDGIPISGVAKNTVILPEAGWYALCFTKVIDADSLEEVESINEEDAGLSQSLPETTPNQPTKSCLPFRACDFDYGFHLQFQNENNEKVITDIKLEMMYDPRRDDIALDVGKFYHFPKECSVTIFRKKKESSSKVSDGNKDNRATINNLKWFLFRKETPISTVYVPSEASSWAAGTPSNAKKSIACINCGKRFGAARAALDHQKQMHSKPIVEKTRPGKELSAFAAVPFPKEINVIYQDNVMAIVDKPQGHAVMGNAEATLLRSDLFLSLAVPPDQQEMGDDQQTPKYKYFRKPRPVHRLDLPTGGLLVIAKTNQAEVHMMKSFAAHKVQKRYRALLLGKLEPLEGEIDRPIDGKPSSTRYRVVEHYPSRYGKAGWVTLVDLFPKSGRTHQLRKHMKYLGHSIWGDRRYGGQLIHADSSTFHDGANGHEIVNGTDLPSFELVSRLCLWAVELSIPHPVTNQILRVVLPDPEWLGYVIKHCNPNAP